MKKIERFWWTLLDNSRNVKLRTLRASVVLVLPLFSLLLASTPPEVTPEAFLLWWPLVFSNTFFIFTSSFLGYLLAVIFGIKGDARRFVMVCCGEVLLCH